MLLKIVSSHDTYMYQSSAINYCSLTTSILDQEDDDRGPLEIVGSIYDYVEPEDRRRPLQLYIFKLEGRQGRIACERKGTKVYIMSDTGKTVEVLPPY